MTAPTAVTSCAAWSRNAIASPVAPQAARAPPHRPCHYQAHYLEVLALGAVKAPLQPGKGPRGVAAAKADQPEFALCHGEPVSIVERLGHPHGLVHPRDRRGNSPISARDSP